MPDKDVYNKVIDAALDLAATRGWGQLSLTDILAHAEIEAAAAALYFSCPQDILAAYGRRVDARMHEEVAVSEDMSHREMIFDILMERFDIINEDRAAVVSILRSFQSAPHAALASLPNLGQSMKNVMALADIPTNGIAGCLRVSGLSGVYLYTLKSWLEDDSPDMAKTMAALDKALDRAEMVYNSLPTI